jgi:flavin reductase (DIM6/NTAB) family NADH-FMN oxidoreductase RutF
VPRIAECPVQMEAELVNCTELMQEVPEGKRFILAIEVKVVRTHIHEDLRLEGHLNRIDPDRWRPLIMSFQELYGLAPKKTRPSKLATIDEEKYRSLIVVTQE